MEAPMSSAPVSSESAAGSPAVKPGEVKLEVVTLPVSDVDRAKRFYGGLEWRLDADIARGDDFRVVQFTPPYSQCSIHFGKGLTAAPPGSVERMILAVGDIDAVRADLVSRGVEVSDVEDKRSDPQAGRSYFQYASFKDPDGNGWLLQEITTRLPGRVTGATFESADELQQALARAEAAHGEHERRTGEADPEWPRW
jgi:catechol 2,3-dioxygenase-like lactoylglutathione lyase family enzyme